LSVRIINQNCHPDLAKDRSLPYTSYLVEYVVGKEIQYDIVVANKKVDIFDYYWDKYREDLLTFTQTEGRVNPKLWDYKKSEGTKKKKND